MPKYQVGDIVLRRWSNAKLLKNKVVKIVGVMPVVPESYWRGAKYRVVNPAGKQSESEEYGLQSFDDAEAKLILTVTQKHKELASAEQGLRTHKQETIAASKLFPRI
jgi:hypothetical protein